MIKKYLNYEKLQSLNLFNDLIESDLKRILSTGHLRSYEDREILFFEGDEAQAVLVVYSGSLIIYRSSPEGREQVFTRLRTGEVVNLVPFLLSDSPLFHANGKADGNTEVLYIPSPVFQQLIDSNLSFCKGLMINLANHLERLTSLAGSLSLQSTRSRLARFLIQQADQFSTNSGYTQEEIGSEIGTVRDVVGRLLREFEANGWLARDRNRVLLKDRQALEKEAEQ